MTDDELDRLRGSLLRAHDRFVPHYCRAHQKQVPGSVETAETDLATTTPSGERQNRIANIPSVVSLTYRKHKKSISKERVRMHSKLNHPDAIFCFCAFFGSKFFNSQACSQQLSTTLFRQPFLGHD
jgi:hypothetical protein